MQYPRRQKSLGTQTGPNHQSPGLRLVEKAYEGRGTMWGAAPRWRLRIARPWRRSLGRWVTGQGICVCEGMGAAGALPQTPAGDNVPCTPVLGLRPKGFRVWGLFSAVALSSHLGLRPKTPREGLEHGQDKNV